MELRRVVEQLRLPASEIAAKSRLVYERVLHESRCLQRGNFESIEPRDLQLLFEAYDEIFLGGAVRSALGPVPLRFRLSRRLTSAAGKTTRRSVRVDGATKRRDYEISISTTLLFQSFLESGRPVSASGLLCHDRLEAVQRVFEHEIVHLSEMLIWSDSACTAPRFQSIAERLFGHTEHTHQLITTRERAWTQLGLKVGDRVRFEFDGRCFEGLLNRITRRATVLVEHSSGVRYTDGKCYTKFYVPLVQLKKAS